VSRTTAVRELPTGSELPRPEAAGRLPVLWPFAVVLAGAAYFALGVLWWRAHRGVGRPSFDTYTYFYPNILHALRSVRDGGGLLWNPYQDCGQPFAAISQTGLLYPINFVFGVFDRETALVVNALLNLTIGGVGMFLLCRALRLGMAAALCGAFAFQLGGTAAMLAAWSPMHIAPYVWIPMAMWRLERLLRAPSFAGAAWLAVVLALQLLPGFPQTVVFTYQLIALRTAWALVTRELSRPWAVLAAVAFGCILPACLVAVQLLPSIDVTGDSLRSLPLGTDELGYSFTWQSIRKALEFPGVYFYPGNVLVAAVVMLSAVAFSRRSPHGLAIFYLGVTVLYAFLSLGPNGALFRFYATLPTGSTFRMPQRFLWVDGFTLAMLAALGADALLRPAAGHWGRGGGRMLALLAVGAVLFFAAVTRWPRWFEWLAVVGLAAAAMLVVWRGRALLPSLMLSAALLLNLGVMSQVVGIGLRGGDIYGGNADAFALLRERMTPQDRVMIVPVHADLALMPKSASIFGVPSVFDYEPLASRAYADYYTFLRTGHGLRTITDWYYPSAGPLPRAFNERLLNLTAARYVLLARGAEKQAARAPGWRMVAQNERWTLLENPQALARARFVPRIEVVPAKRILPTLATGGLDPLAVALVTDPPASGFLGGDGTASGTVTMLTDRPEHVVVQVDATAPGFLYLADQYASGWHATVNGAAAEILPANRAFRVVEVPAGRSEVVFRYRPRSVYVGAVLSALSIGGLVALLVVNRRRRAADAATGDERATG